MRCRLDHLRAGELIAADPGPRASEHLVLASGGTDGVPSPRSLALIRLGGHRSHDADARRGGLAVGAVDQESSGNRPPRHARGRRHGVGAGCHRSFHAGRLPTSRTGRGIRHLRPLITGGAHRCRVILNTADGAQSGDQNQRTHADEPHVDAAVSRRVARWCRRARPPPTTINAEVVTPAAIGTSRPPSPSCVEMLEDRSQSLPHPAAERSTPRSVACSGTVVADGAAGFAGPFAAPLAGADAAPDGSDLAATSARTEARPRPDPSGPEAT